MKLLKLALQIGGFFKDIKNGHVLVWICDRLCFVEAQKAYVFQVAQQKGIQFNSSTEFEAWYKNVEESSFPDGQPKKMLQHRSGNNELQPLIWY